MLPPSEIVNVRVLEEIFKHRSTSYKFLFFLSLIDLLKSRGFGSWESISLRTIGLEMLVRAYVPYKNGLILAQRSAEKTGQVLETLGIPKDLDEVEDVRWQISQNYKSGIEKQILRFVPYRLIRPFFADRLAGIKDDLVDRKILELSHNYFEQLKPLYRFVGENNSIEVNADWGLYLRDNYETIRQWICNEWMSYIASLNPEFDGALKERLFWRTLIYSAESNPAKVAEQTSIYAPKELPQGRIQTAEKFDFPQGLHSELFDGISRAAGPQCVISAFHRIAGRLESLPKPISVCELRLTNGDLSYLYEILNSVERELIRKWLIADYIERPTELGGNTRREVLGLLIFVFSCEITRRVGREGEIWPPILANLPKRFADHLVYNGRPNSYLLSAFVEACTKFGMRNVFGETGLQQYYLSAYLQFGITRKGTKQLANWLASNQTTEAVSKLLSNEPQTASAEFRRFWSTLADYRKDKLSGNHAAAAVSSSSWLPPVSVDELLQAAKAHIDRSDEDSLDDDGRFVSESKLEWDGVQAPLFRCFLRGLNNGSLPFDQYAVYCSDKLLTVLSKDESGRFPRTSITLPANQANLVIELKDMDGNMVLACSLDLWNEDEDVECFHLPSGKKVADSWNDKFESNATYAVLAAYDLKPNDENLRFCKLKEQNRVFWLLTPDKQKTWELFLGDNSYWNPLSGGGSFGSLDAISLSLLDTTSVRLTDEINIQAKLPKGATIIAARCAGKNIFFHGFASSWISENINISEVVKMRGLRVVLIVQQGDKTVRVCREVSGNIIGMMRWHSKKWHLTVPDNVLPSDMARESSFKIFLPKIMSDRSTQIALFEGDRYCRLLDGKRAPIGNVAGYGAPLVAAPLYVDSDVRNRFSLAAEVVDNGIVNSCDFGDGFIKINLSFPICPGDHHQVYLWDYVNEPQAVEGSEIEVQNSNCWSVKCLNSSKIKAIAVAYDGVWQGGFFRETSQCIRISADNLGTSVTAALLRWFHFPILSPAVQNSLAQLIRREPVDVLVSWLDDESLPAYLLYSDDHEAWMAAVREAFKSTNRAIKDVAEKLLAKLRKNSRYKDAIARVFELSPEMGVSVLRAISNSGIANEVNVGARELIAPLVNLAPGASFSDCARALAVKVKDCAYSLKLDDTYLQGLLSNYVDCLIEQRDVTDGVRHNINSCMRSKSFRDCLQAKTLLSFYRR